MLYADPQSSPQRTGIRRIWSSKTKLYFFEHNRRLLCEPWRQCFTTDKLWNRVLSNCSFESSFSTNQTYNCYFRAHTMIRHINYWMCAVQSRGCPLLFEWWFISSSCHVRKAVKIINASANYFLINFQHWHIQYSNSIVPVNIERHDRRRTVVQCSIVVS